MWIVRFGREGVELSGQIRGVKDALGGDRAGRRGWKSALAIQKTSRLLMGKMGEDRPRPTRGRTYHSGAGGVSGYNRYNRTCDFLTSVNRGKEGGLYGRRMTRGGCSIEGL